MEKINKNTEYEDSNIGIEVFGDLHNVNPMYICQTEDEFTAIHALLDGDKPNQYYISGCEILKYKDIPKEKLKWFKIADIYDIKSRLGWNKMRKFEIGKYHGEYICKIIYKDLDYILWCLDYMKGFSLTRWENSCLEYKLKEMYMGYDITANKS